MYFSKFFVNTLYSKSFDVRNSTFLFELLFDPDVNKADYVMHNLSLVIKLNDEIHLSRINYHIRRMNYALSFKLK